MRKRKKPSPIRAHRASGSPALTSTLRKLQRAANRGEILLMTGCAPNRAKLYQHASRST